MTQEPDHPAGSGPSSADAAADAPQRGGFLGELPGIAVAVVLALLIRACVMESFVVPSDSMFPTLLIGDHVFVSKFTYGARVPFTSWRLPAVRDPERGEVIVFQLARDGQGPGSRLYPPDLRPDLPTEAFIKRLVGLPGDVVEMRSGELRINGEPVPVHATGESFHDSDGRTFAVRVEDLGACRHRVLDHATLPGLDNAPRRIEPDRYFFVGDNRDNSFDSRAWGTVDRGDLLGPAGFLYWSWDWQGSWLALLNPLVWWNNLTGHMRWDRMGVFDACQEASSSAGSSARSAITASGGGPS